MPSKSHPAAAAIAADVTETVTAHVAGGTTPASEQEFCTYWSGWSFLVPSVTFSHLLLLFTEQDDIFLIFESLSCGLRWWKLIIIQLPRVTWNCCFPVSSSLQYKRKQEQWSWVATTTHRTVHAVVFSAFINKLLSIFNFQTAKIAMTSWHN